MFGNIAESDLSSIISGRIVVNWVDGELCASFARSLLHTSRTHAPAVGCLRCSVGLPLPRLTGGAVGDATCCTIDSGVCCFTLSPRRHVVLDMYLFPHTKVEG